MKQAALYSSKTNEWETPADFFDKLNNKFKFTLDPCATSENAKCKKYYTKEDDGLAHSWKGETVFCNPPYGREIKHWVEKCAKESKHAKVVMLIPAKTDTIYFHEHIYNKAKIFL
jgi:phage N-6-adenine-methyltransferase